MSTAIIAWSPEDASRIVKGPHAHLVFADPAGTLLRDFRVQCLWGEPPTRFRMVRRLGDYEVPDATLGWNDSFAVTNDASLMQYVIARFGRLPALPAAGDRPAWHFDPARLRVGLINAGGPAPGLNVVNDSITKRHHELATRFSNGERKNETVVFAYRRGYQGLWESENADRALRRQARLTLVPSERMVVAGGCEGSEYFVTDSHALEPVTFLKSSRFNLTGHLAEVTDAVRKQRLDILYVVGGDGSLKGAQALKGLLHDYTGPSGAQLAVVCGPKTMDNDIMFTDATFGFNTTVDYLVDAIRVFHNTVQSQDRLGVMQVFGAASGYVALYAAYCSGEVDYVMLPEIVEYEGIRLLLGDEADACIDRARFLGLNKALEASSVRPSVKDVYDAGIRVVLIQAKQEIAKRLHDKQHALIVVAEGVKGKFEQSGKTQEVLSFPQIVKEFQDTFPATKACSLEPQYLIRDNPPRSYDIALCKFIGKAMVDTALAGYTDCMVTRWCGQDVLVPLTLATCLTHRVDPQDYFYRTMVGKYRLTR